MRDIFKGLPPTEQQKLLDSLGLDEISFPVSVPSGIAGLSRSIDIELTLPGAGSNPSIAFLGSSILADGILQTDASIGFIGGVIHRVDGAVLSVDTQGGPPAPVFEVNNDGSFALAPHQFSMIGGTSTIEATGPFSGLLAGDPLNVPLDLSTAPLDLQQGTAVPNRSNIDPFALNAILTGSNIDGTHEVELYIPFTLAYTIYPVAGDVAQGILIGTDRSVSFDGVIVATGTSSFTIPQSSLLVVPEHSTLLMAMIGLVVARGRRRKS